MTNINLDRVQADLATMRQAAGMELPFGRENILPSLALGVSGLLLAVGWLLTGPAAWPLPVLLSPLVPMLITWALIGRKARRERTAQPRRWREYPRTLLFIVGLLPLIYLFGFWANANAIGEYAIIGSVYFFIGFGLSLSPFFDRDRVYMLGIGIPFVLLGLLYPYGPHSGLLFGLFFAVSGFVPAAIMRWQLRRAGDA